MTDEKWIEIVGRVKDAFAVEEEGEEPLEEEPGKRQWIIFAGPEGSMKLEHISHHYVVGEKSLGSRRIGSGQTIQRKYSDEVIHKLRAYRLNPSTREWDEIETGSTFGGSW